MSSRVSPESDPTTPPRSARVPVPGTCMLPTLRRPALSSRGGVSAVAVDAKRNRSPARKRGLLSFVRCGSAPVIVRCRGRGRFGRRAGVSTLPAAARRPRQASAAGERRRLFWREGAAVVLRACCQAACSSRAERGVGSSRTLEFGPMTAATMRSTPPARARATAVRVARAVSRSSTLLCHGACVRRSSPTIR